MKIIEFLCKTPIENIFGGVCFAPDEIVYFASEKPEAFEKNELSHIKDYMAKKGLDNIRYSYVRVIRGSINDAINKLEEVVGASECVIDITGGDDMLIAAAGIVFERHQNVKLFRINPVNGYAQFIDKSVTQSLDATKFTSANSPLKNKIRIENTVEENIMLHGGAVAPYMGAGAFVYTTDFERDLEIMWQLSTKGPRGYVHKRSAPQTWNRFTQTVSGIERMSGKEQLEIFKKYKVRIYLEELRRLGLVSYTERKDGTLQNFKFKNAQVRACINKAGNLLEQKVYLACRKYLGCGLCDVKTGVTILWSPDRYTAQYYNKNNRQSTENEIDVMAMRGIRPIFISCKNGKFDSEELYKLSSVADRFGIKYAKKILVATDLENVLDRRTIEYLKARAREMNIALIDDALRMTSAEFERILKIRLFE